MNKLAIVAMVAAFALGIYTYNPVQAAPPGKVKLCHIDLDGELDPDTGETVYRDHVIEVSARAALAHAAHGDCEAPAEAQPGDDCACGS